MLAGRRSAGWNRLRALVLASVVFIGGFGLPAFDAIAYHWHAPVETSHTGRSRVQPFGAPQDHAVQCVITHNAPAPRLATAHYTGLRVVAAERVLEVARSPATPVAVEVHSPVQPRAPPASLA